MYVCVYIYIYIYIYMRSCIYVYAYVCVYTYIYIHTYINTYKYTHVCFTDACTCNIWARFFTINESMYECMMDKILDNAWMYVWMHDRQG
jgi:hypothetical protein